MANPTQREQRRGTRQYALAPAGADNASQRLWQRGDERDPGKVLEGAGPGPTVIALAGRGALNRPLPTVAVMDSARVATFDSTDRLKYIGGVAPPDGAAIDALFGRRKTSVVALQRSGRNLPTWDSTVGAARFTASNSQCMDLAGALDRTVSTDLACTMMAVIRPAATPGGEQTIGGCSRDGSVQYYRETARLTLTGGAFRFRGQSNAGTDTAYYASVAYTPVNTETYILIGRHAAGGPGGLNKIAARAGGATLTAIGAASVVLNFSAAASMDRFTLGAIGMFGSFGQHFDGWMLEYDFLSREISDAEVTAWIAELRAKHGVA